MDPQSPIILTITDLSRGGAGVARDDNGRVIFVPFTAPGDRVQVQVIAADRRYAQGVLQEILEPSPLRQKPPCEVFTRCGGCQWQHLPYDTQWKTKSNGVRQALARVAVPEPDHWDEFPAGEQWEYRNRVQLRGFQKELGYFAPQSHQLIPIENCPIARPEINQALKEVREEGSRLPKPYKVEIEVLQNNAVRKHWNASHAAGGFRQVNDEQNKKLQAWIQTHLTPGRVLYDLFGGNGNLSQPLATFATEVHSVDVGAPRQPPADTPPNMNFHRADVLPWLVRQAESFKQRRSSPASAIIDPPREGLGLVVSEIATSLEALGVDEIIAVGCDPDSWAKDVSKFTRRNWKLQKAALLDFFPQTVHVESVALLRL